MSSSNMKIKALLGVALALAFSSVGAHADEPTPAALNYANQIFADIGMKALIDQVVPGMLAQLERNVTTTRPELKDALHETVLAIEPEFVKTEQGVMTDSVKFLASKMTEQELKDTLAFYESPAGKKYVAIEPSVVQEVGNRARAWRQQLSTDILARAHEEMKKKGADF
ncbi:MAG: DUF2059 domain-containing protein [Roseiarcus sp.]